MSIRKKISGTTYNVSNMYVKLNGTTYQIAKRYVGVSENGSVVPKLVYQKPVVNDWIPVQWIACNRLSIQVGNNVLSDDVPRSIKVNGKLYTGPETSYPELLIGLRYVNPVDNAYGMLFYSHDNNTIYEYLFYWRDIGGTDQITSLGYNLLTIDNTIRNYEFNHKIPVTDNGQVLSSHFTILEDGQLVYSRDITGHTPSSNTITASKFELHSLGIYTLDGQGNEQLSLNCQLLIKYDSSESKYQWQTRYGYTASTGDVQSNGTVIDFGPRVGADEVTLVDGSQNTITAYLYNGKAWTDKLCILTNVAAGTYTDLAGDYTYTVNVNGYYTKSPVVNLVQLEYAIPAAGGFAGISVDMNKAWRIEATMQSSAASNAFFIGDAGNDPTQPTPGIAYLLGDSGIAKCYGTTNYSLQYVINTNKHVYDLNCHMRDPESSVQSPDYGWMFLNVDWNGVVGTSGFQVTYSKITGAYNTNPVAFILDGNIALYRLKEWHHDRDDESTIAQVSDWLPYYNQSTQQVVWINSLTQAQVVAPNDTPGPLYGTEIVNFIGQANPCYLYGGKAYSNMGLTIYYTAGTYTLIDRSLEYIISNDGTYTTQVPVVVFNGKIKGTATPNTTFNLAINGSNKSVTSDASGYWEIDAASYTCRQLYNFAANTGARDALLTVDFSSFDMSAITGSCQSMLSGCTNLTSVTGLIDQDLSGVTNLAYAFQNCSGLTSLNLSGLTLTAVTTCAYLIAGCTSLTTCNLNGTTTGSSLTNISFIAQNCSQLTALNISGFNVSNVSGANLARLFNGCSALTTLSLPAFAHGHSAEDYMFNNCTSLTNLTVDSGFKYNTWMARSSNLTKDSMVSLLTAYSTNAPESGNGQLKLHSDVITLVAGDSELLALWTTAQGLGWYV